MNHKGIIFALFVLMLLLACVCIIYLNNRGREQMQKKGLENGLLYFFLIFLRKKLKFDLKMEKPGIRSRPIHTKTAERNATRIRQI